MRVGPTTAASPLHWGCQRLGLRSTRKLHLMLRRPAPRSSPGYGPSGIPKVRPAVHSAGVTPVGGGVEESALFSSRLELRCAASGDSWQWQLAVTRSPAASPALPCLVHLWTVWKRLGEALVAALGLCNTAVKRFLMTQTPHRPKVASRAGMRAPQAASAARTQPPHPSLLPCADRELQREWCGGQATGQAAAVYNLRRRIAAAADAGGNRLLGGQRSNHFAGSTSTGCTPRFPEQWQPCLPAFSPGYRWSAP